MPQNVVPADVYTSPLTCPAGGDLRNSASVLSALQGFANRILYTENRVAGLGATVSVVVPLSVVVPPPLTDWAFDVAGTSTRLGWLQKNTTATPIYFHLPVPPVGILVDVKVVLDGRVSGALHAGLPAVMPRVRIPNQPSTTTFTNVGDQTDTSADVASYEVSHSVTAVCNHTLLPGSTYYVRIDGEGGANALVDDLMICQIVATFARVP